MIKSKTKIESQLRKKLNPVLVETVISAKKNPNWINVASELTIPNRKKAAVNISDLEKAEGEMVVVCGKVLSQGDISKKIKVAALNFSEKAKKKLKDAGCETLTIKEAIESNKDAKGVNILRK